MMKGKVSVPLGWRLVAAIAMLFAAAWLAWVAATWSWRWWGPAPVILPPMAVAADPAAAIASADLFGRAGSRVATTEPNAANVSLGDAKLLGIFAFGDGGGYALFRNGKDTQLVAAGQEIVPGVTIAKVSADGVTIAEGNVRREVVLRPGSSVAPSVPQSATSPTPSANVTAHATTSARTTNCAAPSGFTGQVYKLHGELLSGMIATPSSWNALLAPGGTGLVVRDQSGFAGMLGLKSGDRIELANGVRLIGVDDVSAQVLTPLAHGQSVRLQGTREGKPQQWLLLNAGSCP